MRHCVGGAQYKQTVDVKGGPVGYLRYPGGHWSIAVSEIHKKRFPNHEFVTKNKQKIEWRT